MNAVGWAAILLIATLIGGFLFSKTKKSSSQNHDEHNLRRLKGACFGDLKKAERLIEFEKRKMPWLDKESAAQMAFDRLEKDRSRR